MHALNNRGVLIISCVLPSMELLLIQSDSCWKIKTRAWNRLGDPSVGRRVDSAEGAVSPSASWIAGVIFPTCLSSPTISSGAIIGPG